MPDTVPCLLASFLDPHLGCKSLATHRSRGKKSNLSSAFQAEYLRRASTTHEMSPLLNVHKGVIHLSSAVLVGYTHPQETLCLRYPVG